MPRELGSSPIREEVLMPVSTWRSVVSSGVAVALLAVCATGAGAAPQSAGNRVASVALAQRGVPYVWGGASPTTGFDASGLVMWVYGRVEHVQLPHSAPFLKKLGRPVARLDLQPGDLIFFDHDLDVGIYVGAGRFVHSPGGARTRVRVDSLRTRRYLADYTGARRLLRR